MLLVGVVASSVPVPSSISSWDLCCRRWRTVTVGARKMVWRERRMRWDLLRVLDTAGCCMFARAVEREEDGLSVSMADIAWETAMFWGAVWFISWMR